MNGAVTLCMGCQTVIRRATPAEVCTVCISHIGRFNGMSLPGCHHCFHRACLEKSYASHNDACPNCRVPVVMWPFDENAVPRENRDDREQIERDAALQVVATAACLYDSAINCIRCQRRLSRCHFMGCCCCCCASTA